MKQVALKSIFIVCLSISLFGKNSITKFKNQEQIPQADQIILQIIEDTSQMLAKRYNIEACGFGLSGKFEVVTLEFEVFNPLSKDDARTILFNCQDALIKAINKNNQIHKHLCNYPFTSNNVGIRLFIHSENGSRLYYPNICVARISPSRLYFRTKDPEKEFGYKETIEETPEEARTLNDQYLKSLSQQSDKKQE